MICPAKAFTVKGVEKPLKAPEPWSHVFRNGLGSRHSRQAMKPVGKLLNSLG